MREQGFTFSQLAYRCRQPSSFTCCCDRVTYDEIPHLITVILVPFGSVIRWMSGVYLSLSPVRIILKIVSAPLVDSL
jgi:hypothetical protein